MRADGPARDAAGARIPWQVLDLGLAPYGAVLERQLALLDERIRDRVPDTLILVEHPPVVTLGRAKTTANLRHTPEELRAKGIEFFEISRGGDVTYHAPGQLVGYPVFDLRQHGRDVLRFCRGVEAALIGALEGFGLRAQSVPGKAGVWVEDRKIASLGDVPRVCSQRWLGPSRLPGDPALRRGAGGDDFDGSAAEAPHRHGRRPKSGGSRLRPRVRFR